MPTAIKSEENSKFFIAEIYNCVLWAWRERDFHNWVTYMKMICD